MYDLVHEERTCRGVRRAADSFIALEGRELRLRDHSGHQSPLSRPDSVDGRDALPGSAPDGSQRLDQSAMGENRERPQAKILFDKAKREEGAGNPPHRVDGGP